MSIKTCPACESGDSARNRYPHGLRRVCRRCGSSGPYAEEPAEADAAWNALPRRGGIPNGAPSLDAVIPVLEAILAYGHGWGAEPETPLSKIIDDVNLFDLLNIDTTYGDVSSVVSSWRSSRT